MKKIIYLTIFCISCQKQDSSFLDNLLKNYSRESSFVVLKIETNQKETIAIVKNVDLWRFYNTKKQLSDSLYIKEIKELIIENKPLILTEKEINEYSFISLNCTEKYSLLTKDEITNKYLKSNSILINKDLCLVKRLFDLEIEVKTDDESGELIIAD